MLAVDSGPGTRITFTFHQVLHDSVIGAVKSDDGAVKLDNDEHDQHILARTRTQLEPLDMIDEIKAFIGEMLG